MFAENLQDVREQGYATAEQHEADPIKWVASLGAVVRKIAQHEKKSGHANRKIDKENHAPGEIVDNETANHWAEHGPNECRNGHKAHRAHQFILRESANQRQSTNWHHHGAAQALQDTKCNQLMDIG